MLNECIVVIILIVWLIIANIIKEPYKNYANIGLIIFNIMYWVYLWKSKV